MVESFVKFLPVIFIFFLGIVLKYLKVFSKNDGDMLLRLVFYVAIPALVIKSLSNVQLTPKLALLPLISASIILISFGISYLAGSRMKLQSPTMGVFLIGSMILNIGFTLPYVLTAFGEEGFSRIIIMDFGNAFLVFTFVYYQACKYGNPGKSSGTIAKRLLKAPPIYALIAGIILNLLDIPVTGIADRFLTTVGGLTIPLLMLVVGIYFSPSIKKVKPMFTVLFIRMGLGLIMGLGLAEVFGFEGLTRMIIIIGSATPVGYNTLTFSSLENLDKEFAASLVSASILVGIFYIPLLIYLFSG